MIRAIMAPGSRHAVLRFRANAARSSIALDTLPKVRELCFPKVRLKEYRQDGFFALPNEAQIWIGGLDEKERVEKILGTEFATIYVSECSQVPYGSVIVVRTRLAQVIEASVDGDRFTLPQRGYYDLNPVGGGHWTNAEFGEKRDPLSRKPLPNPENFARIQINPEDNRQNLSADTLAEYALLPERQRKRFYEGLYVDEVEGALWSYERLEACRCEPEDIPQLTRIVVAVDPSGARGEEDKRSDEIGIVKAGKGVDGRLYVLADRSCRLGPAGWARQAVTLYHEHPKADCLIAETNFGGAMVESTIRTEDPNVSFREVSASRGKWVRAEPVAALYEEKIDKARHVGRFPDLEDQLCKFSVSGYTGERSPDRADACVWAATELMLADSSTGFLYHYAAEAEAQAKKRKIEELLSAPPTVAKPAEKPVEAVTALSPFVTLCVPAVSRGGVICGLSRREYTPDSEGLIHVLAEDAGPLKRAGFIDPFA